MRCGHPRTRPATSYQLRNALTRRRRVRAFLLEPIHQRDGQNRRLVSDRHPDADLRAVLRLAAGRVEEHRAVVVGEPRLRGGGGDDLERRLGAAVVGGYDAKGRGEERRADVERSVEHAVVIGIENVHPAVGAYVDAEVQRDLLTGPDARDVRRIAGALVDGAAVEDAVAGLDPGADGVAVLRRGVEE